MPLHLLGKKSWNVYNPENIARVKQDEAAAKAQTEEEERDSHDVAAAYRLQTLRGEEPSSPTLDASKSETKSISRARAHDQSRKRRKLAGEDDTDRDIRLARADANAESIQVQLPKLVDSKGHISLVPEVQRGQREQRDLQQDDVSTGMKFKDAAGYNADGKPWYTEKVSRSFGSEASRDVWGNEDPRRREREQQRMTVSDPLLAMKKGVKQLRQNDRQRKEWIAQRERDLYEVEKLARQQHKKRPRTGSDDDSLEGFSLDTVAHDREEARNGKDRGKRHDRSKHRHRSRSPDRRHRHHHRHHRTKSHPVSEKE